MFEFLFSRIKRKEREATYKQAVGAIKLRIDTIHKANICHFIARAIKYNQEMRDRKIIDQTEIEQRFYFIDVALRSALKNIERL